MGAYSVSAVLKNEFKMDGHISDFMAQLHRQAGTIFDFAPWCQYFAFDVVMDMVFSSPAGFLKAGRDVDNIIASLRQLIGGVTVLSAFPLVTKIVQLPWLFKYLGPKPTDRSGPGLVHKFAYDQVRKRFDSNETHSDVLQWIIDHEDKSGKRLTYGMLEQESLGPVFAGSDSTATVLRFLTLSIASNSRIYAKLMGQIEAAEAAGQLSDVASYDEIRNYVPYMDSLVREALRCYPVIGGPSFRSVPVDGYRIGGHFLPGGTEFGISHWAVSRNKAIFGDECDSFYPERWSDIVSPEEKKKRDAGDIFFSGGPMICTGRNIATMELWKVVLELFRRFEVQIVDSVKPWDETNYLAMVHWNFWVKMTPRIRNQSK
jgi:cytochrome P450